MSNTFSVGDSVWFVHWGNIYDGTIVEVIDNKYAKLHWKQGGTNTMPLERLYKSWEDCIEAMRQKSEEIKDKYRKEINSVEDLVLFVINHDVNLGEYCDYEARAVSIEKAKEFLNIDIKN